MTTDERVAQVVEVLNGHYRPLQPLAPPKAPSLLQRIFDPEANRHYQIEQANRHITEETAELITAMGFVTTHAVAVKLQTLTGIEGLIAEHSHSALARAYAPAIAAHAIEVMDSAIGGTLEDYVTQTGHIMRSRRR
jgi:hypothetical protein